MRLIFMGTPDFSVPVLEALVEAGHDIVAVYSQPPRPAGRGKKPKPSPIAAKAEALGLTVLTPETLKTEDALTALEAHGADLMVVVAYGQILTERALNAARLGAVNIHASLLPRWRGAAPIQRAIMAGDVETGVCIMQMERGLDTGPVMLRATTPISAQDTAKILHDRLSELGADLILRALDLIKAGSAVFTPQPVDGVTYAHKIEKAEARIDWSGTASDVIAHIHGLSPFPGAWTLYGDDRLKLVRVRKAEGSGEPGLLLDDALLVACGKGAIRIEAAQKPGKGVLDRDDLLRGYPIPAGGFLK